MRELCFEIPMEAYRPIPQEISMPIDVVFKFIS